MIKWLVKLANSLASVRIARVVQLKDRVAPVEIERKYGTLSWAQRAPITKHDIEAPRVNASVYIATRAISDAIKSLPVNIVETEITRGIERQVDNNDHPANEIIRNPNPEHSWSDIVDHMVKSFLNDGNAVLTIEHMTGPFKNLEIWPRDPRGVEINTKDRSYRFGVYSRNQKVYPRSRVIHIRDMDVDNPFWGVGRVQTVREEIMMDYFINRFNSNFFKYGATLNLMFTPDHNLTEDQHTQILDAMSAEIGGAEKAFRIFINRYAGKFEYPNQKHKDIAFASLLISNREKIFGVFGLPPFRGGVMEYANYANALAQDKDFWNNTVKPILNVIEESFNKQLIWPLYGEDISLKFDLNSVPAIKGDQTEIEDRLIKLKETGIVSAAYVREQLSINEDAAPDESDISNPSTDEKIPTTEPQPEEREEVENRLYRTLRDQRNVVLTELAQITSDGTVMSVLCDPDGQSQRMYSILQAFKSIRNNLQPVLRSQIMNRGTRLFEGVGVFSMENPSIDALTRRSNFIFERIAEQNLSILRAILTDADQYHWTYIQLQRHIRGIFSYERTRDITQSLLHEFLGDTSHVLMAMRYNDTLAKILEPETSQQLS